jgi:hypothetical protein
METTHQTYIVSESPHRIEPADEETPTEYVSPESAGKAIKDGHHGEYGTRYVLKVALTPVAEYSRAWTMIRKSDHEHVFNPDDLTYGSMCEGSPDCTMTYREYLQRGDLGHA